MSKKLNRVGVVGLGQWGRLLASKSSSIFEIAWTCDRSNAGLVDVPHYKKMEETPEVDAVIVATQTKTHFSTAKYFLERGCDVFLEKPMTPDEPEALDLIEIAKVNRKTLFVDNIFLYTSCFNSLKEELEGKSINSIVARRENTSKLKNYDDVLSVLNYHDAYLIHSLVGDKLFNLKHTSELSDASCNIKLSGEIEIEIIGSYTAPEKIRYLKVTTGDEEYMWDQLEGNLYKNTKIIQKEDEEPILRVLNFFNKLIGTSHTSSTGVATETLRLISHWRSS